MLWQGKKFPTKKRYKNIFVLCFGKQVFVVDDQVLSDDIFWPWQRTSKETLLRNAELKLNAKICSEYTAMQMI